MLRKRAPWVRSAGLLAMLIAGACGPDAPIDDERPTPAWDRTPEPRFTRVGSAMVRGAEAPGRNWLVYGGNYANHRFSALDQLDRENVGRLAPVWIYQTGIAEAFTTTPLVVDNTMYLTTPESRVVALNAASGDKLWEFIPELGTRLLCCGPVNRGVAAWGDKVFVGTVDARLIALNHRSGEVEWESQLADPAAGYSVTMAPLAFDGTVVVGVDGGEYGIRGFLDAYDADSGERRWRWYAVPAPEDAPGGWWGQWRQTDPFGTPLNRDIERERDDSARYAQAWRRGGGPIRMTPAYDPVTRTLFVSVGNPSPNLDGVVRPGDNLYTSSLVALDAGDGSLRWYFQLVPHNRWDMDASSPPFLFDAGGRRFVGHAGKTGWLYVVDAESGEPVFRSQNFVPQENLFTPPTEEGTRMLPGANGGTSWSPVAYSPRHHLAFVLGMHQPMLYTRRYTPYEEGRLYLGGSFTYIPDEDQWGTLSAIDLQSGEIQWQKRLPVPALGAPLVTAGDLLFVGQGDGTLDAFHAPSGELLWQFRAGSGVHGGPVTYAVNGVQFVVVAAGGEHLLDTPRGSAVIAFALPESVATRGPGYGRAGYVPDEPIFFGAVRQVPAAALEPAEEP